MDIGLSIETYNYITPVELGVMVDSYNKKMDHNTYIAWLTASLSQAKKIPKLSELLPKNSANNKNDTKRSKYKMQDYEIEIHLNEFKIEGRLLRG